MEQFAGLLSKRVTSHIFIFMKVTTGNKKKNLLKTASIKRKLSVSDQGGGGGGGGGLDHFFFFCGFGGKKS